MKHRVLYFFDPVCGWCYGFSKHLRAFYDEYRNDYEFEVITGGMVPKAHAQPIAHMAEFLSDAYKRVEAMSGAKFGMPYLDRVRDGQTIFESDTPSLMYHFFTGKHGADTVHCAGDVQDLIFGRGIDPSDVLAYAPLAEKYGVDPGYLTQVTADEEVHKMYEMSMYTKQQFGVEGFPFTIVEIEGEYYLLARGFTPIEELKSTFIKAEEYHNKKRSTTPRS